jgi:hypothetical protein
MKLKRIKLIYIILTEYRKKGRKKVKSSFTGGRIFRVIQTENRLPPSLEKDEQCWPAHLQ